MRSLLGFPNPVDEVSIKRVLNVPKRGVGDSSIGRLDAWAAAHGEPFVEALRSGTPVIASNLAAFREIGQAVPMLLDAADEASWEAAIVDFARPESAARAGQVRRLAGFRAPTWDDHFRRVDEWLPKIASDRAGPGATRSRS